MHKRFVCLSICHVHGLCQAILVFTHQMGWRYSNGNPPPNRDVECRWGRQKSRYWAYIWLQSGVNAATGQMLSTRPVVNHGHRPASYDTYIAGRILR